MLSDKRSGAKTQTFLQSTNIQLIVGFTKYPLLKIYYYNKYIWNGPSRQTEKTHRHLFGGTIYGNPFAHRLFLANFAPGIIQ